MTDSGKRTLGTAIDELISALKELDTPSRIIAIRAACGHLAIPLQSLDPVGQASTAPTMIGTVSGPTSTPTGYSGAPPSESIIDIRSFKEQKGPGSAREMACVVAYYLQSLAPSAERKIEISSSDLEKYFKQAGFLLPKKIAQVLIDAKAAGYFDSTDRGTYKLNAVGYNLVVHTLPRGSSAPKGSSKRSSKSRRTRDTSPKRPTKR
jgi:hypothetical protein